MTFKLQTTNDAGRGLAAEFVRVGDRFGHEIFAVDGNSRQLAAQSVEGTAEDNWPPSPPVQEVHQQGDVLFLTGMAGRSYWSASVSIESPGVLLFDVACRAGSSVDWLGSSYQLLSGDDLVAFEAANATVTAASDAVRIAPTDSARWSFRVRRTLQ
jgi:hypothetical protein